MGCRLVGLLALFGSLVMVSPSGAAPPRRVTLQVGDVFVVAGTDLGCATQVGKNVIRGQKLVACFKSKRGNLAPRSNVAALGANGRVVVGSVTANGNLGRSLFDRTPSVLGAAARQFIAHAGDRFLLAGTDVACAINDDASGVYPTCFRVTPTGGRPRSYAFAETETFVAIVRFDSTGKTTRVVFRRRNGP